MDQRNVQPSKAAAAATGIMAEQIAPRAVAGSRNPTIPTPEVRDEFEPILRSKEGFERRLDVKLVCVAFWLYHLGSLFNILRDWQSPMGLAHKVGALLVSLFVTDLASGILHIYLDHRRCDLNDPFDMAAYAFRYDHHALPLNFLKDSVFLPAGAGEIILQATMPVSAVTHAFLYYHKEAYTTDSGLELFAIVALTFCCFGSIVQATHALAHQGMFKPNPTFPKTISLLQRMHIILPPKTHARHHFEEHDSNFCILNGWSNPLLNALAPLIFAAMRRAPGHFDALAVPGPTSWVAQQKLERAKAAVPAAFIVAAAG